MEEMSLAELEHAASGPHRFVKFIKSFPEAPAKPLPLQTRFCNFRQDGNFLGTLRDVHVPETMRLVPGGRFLFTAGTHLCLWDLGYGMNRPIYPFPIATLQLARRVTTGDLAVALASNGQDILVLVYCRPT